MAQITAELFHNISLFRVNKLTSQNLIQTLIILNIQIWCE